MNNSFICWKWDDETLNGSISEKVEDLCSRFNAKTIFIAFHWVQRRFDDAFLVSKIDECCKELHKRGRKMCIEACIRNEGEGFYKHFPQEKKAYLAHFEELRLDENGNGELELAIEPVYHYWRITGRRGADKIYGLWLLDKAEDEIAVYKDGSLIRKDEAASIVLEESSGISPKLLQFGGDTVGNTENIKSKIFVRAGSEHAGKTAVICLGTEQPLPDLASRQLGNYYDYMLNAIRHTKVDGVFSDEWGYDIILKIEKVNPYDDNNLFLRHFSVSDNFAKRYSQYYPGCNLYEDLLYMRYAAQSQPEKRIAVINRYIRTLRGIMADNDLMMYKASKRILGPDTFYGIHPTWWGSVDSLNFEIFKNGFYWWEAVRDIAQTDEMVSMPIRTALARKWGSGIWYNMWYSLGTKDIKSYYKEAWHNLRYGGRTHYHGYECPNEPVVLELRQEGLLEKLEQMDARIRMLDGIQNSQPDSRVLIIFGMEAATNWALIGNPLPPWPPQNIKLDKVLNTADGLFYKTLCDLVPSTEIENGSLTSKDGRAVYNGHTYDAVIIFYPESMGGTCYEFIKKIDSKYLIVCGDVNIYSDGTQISAGDRAILHSAAKIYPDIPEVDELVKILEHMRIESNRFDNGCILEDRSMIFTGDGNLPFGNPLRVEVCVDGKDIKFEGEDFLFINLTAEKTVIMYPGSGTLKIDGKMYNTEME